MVSSIVTENDVPVGIVTKEKLTFQLSGYYGFTLNQNKPISKIMDEDYLSVKLNSSTVHKYRNIQQISTILTSS